MMKNLTEMSAPGRHAPSRENLPQHGSLRENAMPSPAETLPYDVWESVFFKLSPEHLGPVLETSRLFRDVAGAPRFAAQYIEKAASECPLTVDLSHLEARTERDAALRRLQLGETLPKAPWKYETATEVSRHEKFSIYRFGGSRPWDWAGWEYGFNQRGQNFALMLAKPGGYLDLNGEPDYSYRLKIVSHPSMVWDSARPMFADPGFGDIEDGFKAFLVGGQDQSLVIGCWPSSRVRVWKVHSETEPWTAETVFARSVKTGDHWAVDLSSSCLVILTRDGQNGIKIAKITNVGESL